uniref:Putative SIS domain-containing protein n=1 Tax=viral metagenome TaxID=1070528 RepID=A0A6H1ZEM4_9ZZZZ
MGFKRVSKKLVPALQDIDSAILMVNASDPQFATLGVFYSAIDHLSFFTVLNKCDKLKGQAIRDITSKLSGEVIPASVITGRGIPEIKHRLSNWRPDSKIAILGIFNSGKTSLINALTGEDNPIGDIPGTTLEFAPHTYNNQTLVDTVGQVIDVSQPLMVSMNLSSLTTIDDKVAQCFREEREALKESGISSRKGICDAVRLIKKQVKKGGKVITCGAGASALVAMEMAGQAQETGIPVMCFTNNFATAQPISFAKGAFEDEGAMADYFSRAVQSGDVSIGISTSGGTGFVSKFLELSKGKGAKTVCITENSDTPLGHISDIIIKSEAKPEGPSSSRVQVAHLAIGHALILCVADVMGMTAEKAINYMLPDIIPNKKMGIK